MVSTRSVVSILIVVLSALFYLKLVKPLYDVPPLPKFEDTWWGPGDSSKEDSTIREFRINISDEILEDLQQRLESALPLQPSLEGAKQHYGMHSNLLKDIVDFWKTKYNWREREKFLNQFPQFKVGVQGLNIHYLHVKPKTTENFKVVPLLLLHGWPGSVREFYEMIPLLTSPQKGRGFVFEVIAPSLPGYGFSDAAVRPGLGAAQMAVVLKNFMKKIGYGKYYIQGGDWGSVIAKNLVTLFPEHVLGVHSNMCSVNSVLSIIKLFLGSFYPPLIVEKEQEDKVYPLGDKFMYLVLESGYFHIQSTKPDTVGVALRESPVGLAAYILEKFTTVTNPAWKNLEDGGLTRKFTFTQLLDNVMIYWVTRSITTSMRLYSETFNKAQLGLQMDKFPVTEVPYGCVRFEHEITFPPESVIREKFKNLVHLTDREGGHFAALEVPVDLAEDIYAFTEKVEKTRNPDE